jgi:hypothetical protein
MAVVEAPIDEASLLVIVASAALEGAPAPRLEAVSAYSEVP